MGLLFQFLTRSLTFIVFISALIYTHAHFIIQLFKKLAEGGFLGPTRDPEYGGLGLDYSYSIAIAEELGSIRCGGVPMAIGVHTGTCACAPIYHIDCYTSIQ